MTDNKVKELMKLIDKYAEEAGKHNGYDNTYFLKQSREAVVNELTKVLKK